MARETHAARLNHVRYGWAGQHPIQVSWLEDGQVRTEVVYVLNVDHTSVTLTTEQPRKQPLAKLVRVNGALTTFGAVFEALHERQGQVVCFRYAKARTGEIKEYTGIHLGVQNDKHLALRVDDQFKRFLLERIQEVDPAWQLGYKCGGLVMSEGGGVTADEIRIRPLVRGSRHFRGSALG